jgi:hypothetical protein
VTPLGWLIAVLSFVLACGLGWGAGWVWIDAREAAAERLRLARAADELGRSMRHGQGRYDRDVEGRPE